MALSRRAVASRGGAPSYGRFSGVSRLTISPRLRNIADRRTNAQPHIRRSPYDTRVRFNQRFERAFLGERGSACGAFRQMFVCGPQLSRRQFPVRMRGDVFADVFAAIQLTLPALAHLSAGCVRPILWAAFASRRGSVSLVVQYCQNVRVSRARFYSRPIEVVQRRSHQRAPARYPRLNCSQRNPQNIGHFLVIEFVRIH